MARSKKTDSAAEQSQSKKKKSYLAGPQEAAGGGGEEDLAVVKRSVVLTPSIDRRMERACEMLGDITFAKLVRMLAGDPLDFLLQQYSLQMIEGDRRNSPSQGEHTFMVHLDGESADLVNQMADKLGTTSAHVIRGVVEQCLSDWVVVVSERREKVKGLVDQFKEKL